MERISALDRALFHYINSGLTTGLLDMLMPYVSEKMNFLGAVLVAVVLVFALGKRRDRRGLLILIGVVLLSDLASNVLKNLIMRTRPCNAFDVRLLLGCGSSFSMPSAHATNITAAMVFLTTRYKRFFPAFLSIAFAVSYSRVYVGVHYPLDVLAGAALGAIIAVGASQAEKRILKGLKNRGNTGDSEGASDTIEA
jgi:undecaprenyl-diphosphatase